MYRKERKEDAGVTTLIVRQLSSWAAGAGTQKVEMGAAAARLTRVIMINTITDRTGVLLMSSKNLCFISWYETRPLRESDL
jgi:hypothetical protein